MMRRYPAYKDTGVEWLGEVPDGWEVRRLGYCFTERREKVSDRDFPPLSVTMNGIVPQLDTAAKSDDGDNRLLVRAGDFVVNSRSDRKGSSGLSDRDGSVSLISIVLTPRSIIIGRFAHWLLKSRGFQEEFYRWGSGIVADLWTTRFGDMSSIALPLPLPAEQTAIAAFLDRETAKIDALVAEQRRLIDLLREKRQAVISHAVTKGLNPAAPMKPSGVDWLGDVPEGWEVVQARRFVIAFEQGHSPDCDSRPAVDGEWAVLKSGCVNRGVYRDDDNKALPESIPPRTQLEVVAGDLLMSRASGSPDLIGSVALVVHTAGRRLISDKIFRLQLSVHADSHYVKWLFASDALRGQIVNAISGAEGMANNLPQSKIKEFWCALPPLEQQTAIAHYVEHAVQQIDMLCNQTDLAITLLQERRAALISAAVTGKIDVRDLASVETEAA